MTYEWHCPGHEAEYAVRFGKTWSLVPSRPALDADLYSLHPCPMTLEWALRRIDERRGVSGKPVKRGGYPSPRENGWLLAALTYRRTQSGDRYWVWVPIDDPGSWSASDVPAPTVSVS